MKDLTFEKFDKLQLKDFAKNTILNAISDNFKPSDNPIDQGAFTIMLNSGFGTGKSTFLHMLQNFIEQEHKEAYEVLYLNSWDSDFYKDPLISILYNFHEHFQNGKIKESIAKFVELANQITRISTGLDAKAILEKQTPASSLIDELKKIKATIEDLEKAIEDHLGDKKLIVLVDELDRTRPDYAVKFLEDIKHFFRFKNVVFVFGINKSQLLNTVKCLYGNEIDEGGYLKKFFNLSIDLPDYKDTAYYLVEDISKKTKVKMNNSNIAENIYLSFRLHNLNLRELNEFFVIFEQVLKTKGGQSTNEMYIDCTSYFICLYLKNRDAFDKFLDLTFTLEDIKLLINEVEKIDKSERSDMYRLLSMVMSSTLKRSSEDDFENDLDRLFQDFLKFPSRFFDGNSWDIVKPRIPHCLEICRNIKEFS